MKPMAVPAAPGTYVLSIDDGRVVRRAVVAWLIETEKEPLKTFTLPLVVDGAYGGQWLDADAVVHPGGRVEAVQDDRTWPSYAAWARDHGVSVKPTASGWPEPGTVAGEPGDAMTRWRRGTLR